MGIRNRDREVVERLSGKTLDAKFVTEIGTGLNCSHFEAEAVLDVVKEVYFPFFDAAGNRAPPGKINAARAGPGRPTESPARHVTPVQPIGANTNRTDCAATAPVGL